MGNEFNQFPILHIFLFTSIAFMLFWVPIHKAFQLKAYLYLYVSVWQQSDMIHFDILTAYLRRKSDGIKGQTNIE